MRSPHSSMCTIFEHSKYIFTISNRYLLEDFIMRLSTLFTAAIAASMLAACTLSNEKWSNFDNQSANIAPQENHAGLVFYRPDAGANSIAVNIKVNGEYLSSLQVGGFTKTEICAKPTALEAYYVAMQSGTNLNVNLAKQSVHYFYVDTSNASKPQLKEVDAATAQDVLKTIKHQAHTISRVNNTACSTH